MATNAVKAPVFRAVTSRSYSSQKTHPVCGIINEVKTTVLPNKLVVASADSGSALSRLSIIFRAGSRYEIHENAGVTHVLRNAAGLSTKNSTQFAITRNIQQVGASLTCTTDRETIAYTLEGTYDAVERGSEFLSDIASQQVFKPWEVSDSMPRLKLELASLTPEVKAVNFLHRAAYRTGLGNSMFCAKHMIGKISSETLQHYVCSNFKSNRAAVVGLGVNHEQLVGYAQNICLDSGAESQVASKYHGGELRSEKGGEYAYVAVAAKGAALSNTQEAVAFAVLQRALGTGPSVRWGAEPAAGSLLHKALAPLVKDKPVVVHALNASYTDSGLFGFLAVCHYTQACEVITNAVKALKAGGVTAKDVERAKTQLKVATLLNAESGSNFIEVMAKQAVLFGSAQTPQQIAKVIDDVSLEDVQQAAKKVASSKLSLGAVGSLAHVPHLDEL